MPRAAACRRSAIGPLHPGSLLFELREFILIAPVLLFSFVAHEYAHARTALWQGDDTAYMLGRVTFNPLPHIDPWMTIIMPAVLWFMSNGAFTFGGAKPVPVVPRKYRKYVRGDLIVSSAGVITNLLIALCCSAIFVLLGLVGQAAPGVAAGLGILQRMMMWGVWLNLTLCFFNLIPIPPLDGSHLLFHALPPAWGARYRQIGQLGFLPLMLVLVLFRPLVDFFLMPAYWVSGSLFSWIAPFGLGDIWNISNRG
jgi:Zn-dependent protease